LLVRFEGAFGGCGMEVEELIERAKVEGWKELDLSDRGLTELPDTLWELTALESLDLSGNKLTELPGAIGQLVGLRSLVLGRFDNRKGWRGNQLTQLPPEVTALNNLTQLVFRYNCLTQLPPEIVQLTNLTQLDLFNNELTQLPPEIIQLTNLTELHLSSNYLTQLPPEIVQLTNLTELHLSDNGLTQLPSEIIQLTNLTNLYFRYNNLTQLPPEIAQLTNLIELYLRNNQLSQLPPEIGALTNLIHLDLSKNQLSQLPTEVGALTNLTTLDLNSNQLSQLPTEVGALTNLTTLDLNSNQLSQLPDEFGQLTNLTTLDLNSNQLTRLPADFGQFSKLIELDLRGNLLPIPPEVLERYYDPANILNFYTEYLAGQKKPLNEAKLLIVGQGSVGKTSLVNRLLYNDFNPHENKTEGIDIQPWQVGDIQLNVWDFGGQEIMHATHQFFLTKRSLYLLVIDTRLGEDENRLDYWLKIIQSFGSNSPVIVVGNKADQQALDLDQRGLEGKYPSIKAFIETSCQSGQGIDNLKAAITRQINQMEHIKDELPLSWFELKTQIEDMKCDYIPYPDYVKLCQKKSINEQSQQTLIGFLHDLGVVLNFRDDPRLEDTNILNPVWVTNGVYQILNDNALMTEHKGILERSMLSKILDSKRYPKNKQLFIIDMMRKFELCFDLDPDKQFLIPDLLSKEEPDTGEWDNALAFHYNYNVLPGSIISRFIVRTHTLLSKKTYWRSGAVLSHEGSRALVKADREDKKIFIWVTGSEGTRRQLLGIIRSHFDHIHGTITGIEVSGKVPLPEYPEIVLDYQDLLELEAMRETYYVVPRIRTKVNVKQLLDGIEPMRSHSEQESNAKYDLRGATIHGFAPESEGSALIAGETVQGSTAIGTQNNAPSEQLNKDDVIEMLAQIKALIEAAELPAEVKAEAKANLKIAKKATEQEEKQTIAANLEGMAETLEEASKSVEAGKTLWGQVSPILIPIAGWLEAAAGSILSNL